MSTTKAKQKRAKRTTAGTGKPDGFTAEERAAMKEHAQELKTQARRGGKKGKADGESEVLAKIAEMAERRTARSPSGSTRSSRRARRTSRRGPGTGCPHTPRTARSSASSRARRSSSPGTRPSASTTRPTSTRAGCGRPRFALKELTAAEEAKIAALVKRAVS